MPDAKGNPTYPFVLPALRFDPAALEPHFDAASLRLHHGVHHRRYVERLNAAIAHRSCTA